MTEDYRQLGRVLRRVSVRQRRSGRARKRVVGWPQNVTVTAGLESAGVHGVALGGVRITTG
jgi:hypothetical protein